METAPPSDYDPRQQRNDAVLGLIPDERRNHDPEYPHRGNGRNTEFPHPLYRNERVVSRSRESGGEDFETRDDSARSMAAHPLFRGLLQELPPRAAPPSKEWLDQWTSTARSILELLYSRDPLT